MATVTSSSSLTAARLPKLGIYSSSTDSRREGFTKLTDVGQQLTCINDVTSRSQLHHMSKSCDKNKEQGLDEISAAVKGTIHHSTGHAKLRKQSNYKRTRAKPGHNRPRSTTWPSLQYNMWLDVSNLPLHTLSNDERVTHHTITPSHSTPFPLTSASGRSRIQDVLPMNGPLYRYHDNQESDDIITSNLPQLHISNRSTMMMSQATPLSVGTGNTTWRVQSSYSARRRRSEDKKQYASKVCDGRKMSQRVATPAIMVASRLPSRMGRNSFNTYLHQTSMTSSLPNAVDGNSLRNVNKDTIIELKSLARNPNMSSRESVASQRQRSPSKQIATVSQSLAGDVRIPHGERLISDVTPPLTPPTLEGTYKVQKYITSTYK